MDQRVQVLQTPKSAKPNDEPYCRNYLSGAVCQWSPLSLIINQESEANVRPVMFENFVLGGDLVMYVDENS